MNIIKDAKGNILREAAAEDRYIIESNDGSMTGVLNFKEGVAVILGTSYLDCETAETEWHFRLSSAKKIGLLYETHREDNRVIVYDERIGKIPYSYTDPNPDYKIPENPKLIRVETDVTFLLTLAELGYIKVWERTGEGAQDFENYLKNHDVEKEIQEYLIPFQDKKQNIPLYERL